MFAIYKRYKSLTQKFCVKVGSKSTLNTEIRQPSAETDAKVTPSLELPPHFKVMASGSLRNVQLQNESERFPSSAGPTGATRLRRVMLMLQDTVLQVACTSSMCPTSLHVLSLGGARLQSGASKLVGTGA